MWQLTFLTTIRLIPKPMQKKNLGVIFWPNVHLVEKCNLFCTRFPLDVDKTLWELQMELLTFEIMSGKPEHGKIIFFENVGISNEHQSVQPLLYIAAASNSSKEKSTIDLNLKVTPLTLCYNFEFFHRVHCLQRDILRNTDVEKVAMETLENLQAWAEQGIAEIISSKQIVKAKIQILSPKVIFPLAANHTTVMHLGYMKATYGNSVDAPHLKIVNVSIGHLEIDDSLHFGKRFQKMATSNSTDSEDLIYAVCNVDYLEEKVTTEIKFEELALSGTQTL